MLVLVEKFGKREPRLLLELLGHKSAKTAMIYTHFLNKGLSAVMSLLDISMETQRFQLRIQTKPQEKPALARIFFCFIILT